MKTIFAPLAHRLWLALCARLGRCEIEWISAAHGVALQYGLRWSWRLMGATHWTSAQRRGSVPAQKRHKRLWSRTPEWGSHAPIGRPAMPNRNIMSTATHALKLGDRPESFGRPQDA